MITTITPIANNCYLHKENIVPSCTITLLRSSFLVNTLSLHNKLHQHPFEVLSPVALDTFG